MVRGESASGDGGDVDVERDLGRVGELEPLITQSGRGDLGQPAGVSFQIVFFRRLRYGLRLASMMRKCLQPKTVRLRAWLIYMIHKMKYAIIRVYNVQHVVKMNVCTPLYYHVLPGGT
jgi:hypothetical protein